MILITLPFQFEVELYINITALTDLEICNES